MPSRPAQPLVDVAGRPVPAPAPLAWRRPAAPGTAHRLPRWRPPGRGLHDRRAPDFVRTAKAPAARSSGPRDRRRSPPPPATPPPRSAYAAARQDRGMVRSRAAGRLRRARRGPRPRLTGAAGVVVTASRPDDAGLRPWPTRTSAVADGAAVRSAPAVPRRRPLRRGDGRAGGRRRRTRRAPPLEDEGIAAFKAADGGLAARAGTGGGQRRATAHGDSPLGHGSTASARSTPRTWRSVSPTARPWPCHRPGRAVAGGTSVVVLDGRQATFSTAGNGAIGATNVVLDVFGPGRAAHLGAVTGR